MIVIEENGSNNGNGFDVYMAGDMQRIPLVSESEMTPAEFWGSRLFVVCMNVLQQSGVVKSKIHKDAN
jgi:hypothetical protein